MGRHRLATAARNAVSIDRVLRGRDGEAGGDLDRRDDVGGGDEHVVGCRVQLLGLQRTRPRDLGPEIAVLGFTADDQRDVEITAHDRGAHA